MKIDPKASKSFYDFIVSWAIGQRKLRKHMRTAHSKRGVKRGVYEGLNNPGDEVA